MKRPSTSYSERCATWDKEQLAAARAILERPSYYNLDSAVFKWAVARIARAEREEMERTAPLFAAAGGRR